MTDRIPAWAYRDAAGACAHLVARETSDFWRRFLGDGRSFAYACQACVDDASRSALPVAAELVESLERDGEWLGCRNLAMPAIDARQTAFAIDIKPSALRLTDLQALVPVPNGDGEAWIALTGGELVWIDGSRGTLRSIASIDDDLMGLIEPVTLTPARLGLRRGAVLVCDEQARFVAVAPEAGRYGCVIDVERGVQTMRLDRGDYHEEVCRFPLAFAQDGERSVLLHGTAWNRVDGSDPATGECLTSRAVPEHRGGNDTDPHYLDYFACGLAVSPGGQHVITDGWVWHPWGVLRAWNIRSWLHENVWEFEDGPTHFDVEPRPDIWDGPVTWLDDDHVAVWGFGVDQHLHDAVRIFDVRTKTETDWFPGPAERLSANREHLYSLAPHLRVFDVRTGDLVFADAACTPMARHPVTNRLLCVDASGAVSFATVTATTGTDAGE